MSPFLSNVYGATLAGQKQQNAQQMSGLQGTAAQAGAFGGDRAGIAAANMAYQQNLANSQTNANLLNTGYTNALNTAGQQQALGLSAGQANRAALQQASNQMLGLGQQQFNQGATTASQQAALGQQQYGQQANAAQQYAALGQQQFGQGATAAQQQAALGQQQFAQGTTIAQQQAALGQQQFGQGATVAQQQAALGHQQFGQGATAAQQQAALGQQAFGQGTTIAQQQAALGQQQFGQGATVAQQQAALGQQQFGQGATAAQQQAALGQQMFGQGATAAQQQAALGQQQFGQGATVAQQQAALGQQQFGQGATAAQQQAALGQQMFGQGATAAQQQASMGLGAAGLMSTAGQQQAALGQQQFNQGATQAQQLAALGQQQFGQGATSAQQLAAMGQGQAGLMSTAGGQQAALGQQQFAQGATNASQLAALGQQQFGQGQASGAAAQGIGAGLYGMNSDASKQLAALGQQQFGQGQASGAAAQGLGSSIYNTGANTSQLLAQFGAGAQAAGLQGAQAQQQAGLSTQQTDQAALQAMYNQFLQQQAYPFQTTQFLANIAEGTGALSGGSTSTTSPTGLLGRASGGRAQRYSGGVVNASMGGHVYPAHSGEGYAEGGSPAAAAAPAQAAPVAAGLGGGSQGASSFFNTPMGASVGRSAGFQGFQSLQSAPPSWFGGASPFASPSQFPSAPASGFGGASPFSSPAQFPSASASWFGNSAGAPSMPQFPTASASGMGSFPAFSPQSIPQMQSFAPSQASMAKDFSFGNPASLRDPVNTTMAPWQQIIADEVAAAKAKADAAKVGAGGAGGTTEPGGMYNENSQGQGTDNAAAANVNSAAAALENSESGSAGQAHRGGRIHKAYAGSVSSATGPGNVDPLYLQAQMQMLQNNQNLPGAGLNLSGMPMSGAAAQPGIVPTTRNIMAGGALPVSRSTLPSAPRPEAPQGLIGGVKELASDYRGLKDAYNTGSSALFGTKGTPAQGNTPAVDPSKGLFGNAGDSGGGYFQDYFAKSAARGGLIARHHYKDGGSNDRYPNSEDDAGYVPTHLDIPIEQAPKGSSLISPPPASGGSGGGMGKSLGSLLGGGAGSFFGPAGTFIGSGLGGILGGLFANGGQVGRHGYAAGGGDDEEIDPRALSGLGGENFNFKRKVEPGKPTVVQPVGGEIDPRAFSGFGGENFNFVNGGFNDFSPAAAPTGGLMPIAPIDRGEKAYARDNNAGTPSVFPGTDTNAPFPSAPPVPGFLGGNGGANSAPSAVGAGSTGSAAAPTAAPIAAVSNKAPAPPATVTGGLVAPASLQAPGATAVGAGPYQQLQQQPLNWFQRNQDLLGALASGVDKGAGALRWSQFIPRFAAGAAQGYAQGQKELGNLAAQEATTQATPINTQANIMNAQTQRIETALKAMGLVGKYFSPEYANGTKTGRWIDLRNPTAAPISSDQMMSMIGGAGELFNYPGGPDISAVATTPSGAAVRAPAPPVRAGSAAFNLGEDAGGPSDSYVGNTFMAESGDNPNLQNQRSSAAGSGQFLNQTWLDMVRKNRPDIAGGKNDAEILALKTDRKLNEEMTLQYAKDNTSVLRQNGLPANDVTLKLMHGFGSGDGPRVIQTAATAPNTPMEALFPPSKDASGKETAHPVLSANPSYAGRTVGQVAATLTAGMQQPAQTAPQTQVPPAAAYPPGSYPALRNQLTALITAPGGEALRDPTFVKNLQDRIDDARPIFQANLTGNRATQAALAKDTSVYQQSLQQLGEAKRILSSFETGKTAPIAAEVQAWAHSILGERYDELVKSNPDASTLNQQLLKNAIKQIYSNLEKVSGPVHVAQLQGMGQTVESAGIEPETNRRIVSALAGAARRGVDYSQEAVRAMGANDDQVGTFHYGEFQNKWLNDPSHDLQNRYVDEEYKDSPVKGGTPSTLARMKPGALYVIENGQIINGQKMTQNGIFRYDPGDGEKRKPGLEPYNPASQ